MTVSSTSSRVVLSGDGSNTAWPFAFKVEQPADLVVVYTDAAGSDVTLSAGQYDATGFGLEAGGVVTYPKAGSGSAPIADGTTLAIWRNVAVTQPTSISNQGAMWPAAIEKALDRLTLIVQQFIDGANRSLRIAPNDGTVLNLLPPAAVRANGGNGSFLGFDATGQPYAAGLVPTVQGWALWLLQNFATQATSASAARTALGAAAGSDVALRSVSAIGVNFNAANSDNALPIALPAGHTRYRLDRVVIGNASHTLVTATCGLFTAAGGGGVAAVASGSAIAVSATADATANNMQSLALASAVTSFTAATLYFRVQTAEGAPATGDVTIFYQPLP